MGEEGGVGEEGWGGRGGMRWERREGRRRRGMEIGVGEGKG